jgi:hypothetical protein
MTPPDDQADPPPDRPAQLPAVIPPGALTSPMGTGRPPRRCRPEADLTVATPSASAGPARSIPAIPMVSGKYLRMATFPGA